MRTSRNRLFTLYLLITGIPLSGAGGRLDYYDEALRLFGAASAGESIRAHRALQGNRIVYDKSSNLYPDERTVRHFKLDYSAKMSGDMSVCFEPDGTANAAWVGFMPGPYCEDWKLGPEWDLVLWLRAESGIKDQTWPLELIDHAGRTARGELAEFKADGQWQLARVKLSELKAGTEFDWSQIAACQIQHQLGANGKLWFDDVHFANRQTGMVTGVTDKSIDQRRTEAAASRTARVTKAFQDIASYQATTLKADGRHVYWRDLLNPLFARLWLGQDLKATNAELIRILTSQDTRVRNEYELDDPWSLYLTPLLIQLYYTFGSKADRLPGRLEPETEKILLESLWQRTAEKNDILIARQSPWWMAGSENHDINAKVANLLSSQIFMHEPAYADRVYPDLGQGSGYHYGKAGLQTAEGGGRANLKDGRAYRARDHYEAWVVFWKKWFLARAQRGPFIEVNSPTYMLYSLGFLQSLHDLAEDEHLRTISRKFFDLVYADWAQDQITGMRGGARTRSGVMRSGYDSMTQYTKFLFGGPGNAWHGFYQLLLSKYELPALVWEMALDRESLGSFAYVSRRPGEEEDVWPRPPGNERTLLCDTDSRLLRYSWVTPDYVLGTQMDHPAAAHSHLSIDRRSQSMIFAGAPDCQVQPGPLYSGDPGRLIGGASFDENAPDTWKLGSDHVYRSVQYRNVLITQQARTVRRISPEWFPDYELLGKPYGILFRGDFDIKEEKGGWIFVAKGDAYLAVRVVVAREDHSGDAFRTLQADKSRITPLGEQGYVWNADRTIARLKNKHSPIIFEAGRRADYPTLADFERDILDNPITLYPTVVAPNLGFDILSYTGGGQQPASILFNTANSEIPTVDGRHIQYAPARLFDSPYLSSDYGSAIITVHKGEQKLILDFNQ